MNVLSTDEIDNRLAGLTGWNYKDHHICKEYELNNFEDALVFVNKLGEAAEHMNHHPDIFIHSWNKVNLTITTHSEGGVTEKDFILAKKIERISNEAR
jgi:4a-hydroxytetrahydrobiopterin dehydratase